MSAKVQKKTITSVSHALQLLEVFRTSADKDEFGVTELSNKLGLHKNNIFRLLATLESRNCIEQNMHNESYRLGINIFNLGQRYINKLGIIKLAHPFLEKIAEEVQESVYIGMLREGNVVYLDLKETSNPVRVVSRVGKDVPAYATAIGKIQLSYLSDEEISKMYGGEKLTKYTKSTITSLSELKRNLKEILKNDYAIEYGEYEASVSCVALPVKDYLGIPVAALSVTGPSFRMSPERIEQEILPVTRKYSHEISKRLGFTDSDK